MPKINKDLIIVVDDDAGHLTLLQTLLTRFGDFGDVRVAGSIEKALALLEECHANSELPVGIVTDFHMNGETGLDLIKALKADIRTLDIPVIVNSAAGGPEAEQAVRDAGAVDFITKPYGAREFAERVRAKVDEAQKEATERATRKTEELPAVDGRLTGANDGLTDGIIKD